MAKVRCTACNAAFELTPDSPTINCPSCGKMYKNPIYRAPEAEEIEEDETPTVKNTRTEELSMSTMPSAMANLMQNAQTIANNRAAERDERDDREKCATHKNLNAVAECDKCGAPICEICYDNFDLTDDGETYHFCADCYKEFMVAEREEADDLKKMVRKEFIGIIAGMVIGLILAILFILDVMNGQASPVLAVVGVYAMFLGGSFITIAKKIKHMYDENRSNDGSVNFFIIVMYIVIGIMISPIVTIARIVLRIIDYKKLNGIITANVELVNTFDNAVRESITQTMNIGVVANMADALESGGEEINIDLSLSDGITIGAHGEVLRAIRTR